MSSVKQYYQNNQRFLIAVDCIIFGFKENELCLLLLKRGFEPGKGKWSLAGGFLKQTESLNQAAQRILTELMGLQNIFMDQVDMFGDIDRDPGERVISSAHYALINMEHYNDQMVNKFHTRWFNIKNIPDLVFDHKPMVMHALERLRQKAASQPIGFNLLPEKFTLNQLQRLYEAIYQLELDNRNFRKKFMSYDFIEKLEEKDKASSKRGAFYYRFNKEKYENATNTGFNIFLSSKSEMFM